MSGATTGHEGAKVGLAAGCATAEGEQGASAAEVKEAHRGEAGGSAATAGGTTASSASASATTLPGAETGGDGAASPTEGRGGPLPAWLEGDPQRLKQIIMNLLSNAIKFTPQGGRVHLAGRLDRIEQQGQAQDRRRVAVLRFTVTDTGIGMESETISRLFRPFTQADSSTTRRFGGAGLGLAISKALVTLFGGEIGASSSPGRGSTFWFTVKMPIVDGPPGTRPERVGACIPVGGAHAQSFQGTSGLRAPPQLQAPAGTPMPTPPSSTRSAPANHPQAAHVHTPSAVGPCLSCETVPRPSTPMIHHTRSSRSATVNVEAASYRVPPPLQPMGSGGSGVPGQVKPGAATGASAAASAVHGSQSDVAQGQRQTQVQSNVGQASASSDATAAGRTGTATGAASDAGGRRAPASPADVRVLVAEDNAVNQLVIKRFLKTLGYRQVTVVEEGAAAVRAVEGGDYDVVLMDCAMPVLDGYEATRQIRRMGDPRKAQMPIIAVTASALQADVERALSAGMNDHLSKPYTSGLLQCVLDRWSGVNAGAANA